MQEYGQRFLVALATGPLAMQRLLPNVVGTEYSSDPLEPLHRGEGKSVIGSTGFRKLRQTTFSPFIT